MSLTESLFSVDEELESISGESFGSNSYSSAVSSTSTGRSRLSLRRDDDDDNQSLATQENKDLTKFRLFLVTILFWTTIGVGLAVWIYFTEETEKGFEEFYDHQAQELYEESTSKIIVALGAIDSFALALSAKFSDWPFVTVPKFSIRAERLRNLSNAVQVSNYYYVQNDQLEQWEAYSTENDFWLEEGIQNQETNLALPRKNSLIGNRQIEGERKSFLVSYSLIAAHYSMFDVSKQPCSPSATFLHQFSLDGNNLPSQKLHSIATTASKTQHLPMPGRFFRPKAGRC